MTGPPLRIFVGWDEREDIAYRVCKHSLERRAGRPVAVEPLVQDALRRRGLYRRPPDPLASTDFTYTRFLVPELVGFDGWALYCDCDFLWLADVAALFALADPRFAVMCVHHDHRPPETTKMDGRTQTRYPRKNWSSLVLYNCGHPANRALTSAAVSDRPAAYLHRFQWLDDDQIGAVPETWNWLEGWCEPPADGPPNVIHYTRGGPWFASWADVAFAALWSAERRHMEQEQAAAAHRAGSAPTAGPEA